MRTRTLHVIAALVAGVMTVSLSACGEDDGAGTGSFTVGLLLPNRVTPRWEHSDKPLIQQRLKELTRAPRWASSSTRPPSTPGGPAGKC